jgi:hypothetical protein
MKKLSISLKFNETSFSIKIFKFKLFSKIQQIEFQNFFIGFSIVFEKKTTIIVVFLVKKI